MPNLAATLKSEIRRLAKKEIRSELGTTKQTTVQHRREIAKLKRLLQDAEKRIGFLERQERKRFAEPTAKSSAASGHRFSSRSVRAQRQRLELSAEEYGKLLGVSAQTIYLWEHGKTRPRAAQMTKLVEARELTKREAKTRLRLLSDGQQGAAPSKRRGRPRKAK